MMFYYFDNDNDDEVMPVRNKKTQHDPSLLRLYVADNNKMSRPTIA